MTDYKILHICIPLWNRGPDIEKLLANLEEIHQKIDKSKLKFEVHITDFHSTDIDLNIKQKEVSYPLHVYNLNGQFNIGIALQNCFNQVSNPDHLVMICDADTVFENGEHNLLRVINDVKQGINFYCPVVSFEDKPRGSRVEFKGGRYTPQEDTGGRGFMILYNSDLQRSGTFGNSPYLSERGKKWGGHDSYLAERLSNLRLHCIRPIEEWIWLRAHDRDPQKNGWFSDGGSQLYE
jgi:glycosyltransferase involved in cell wall biosynthesis